MLFGGAVFLSYRVIMDTLRHHHETNNDRPLVFDHLFATSTIGAGIGFVFGAMPRHVFTGWFVGALLLGPISWWMKQMGRKNHASRSINFIY